MYCSLYSDGLCTTLNITWTATVAWFPPNGLLVALQNRQDIKKGNCKSKMKKNMLLIPNV